VRADRHLRRTDLFLVRLWADDDSEVEGQREWRGRVQRVVNGETYEFEGWNGLVDHLAAMFPPSTMRATDRQHNAEQDALGE
jgi:hypothetical protein